MRVVHLIGDINEEGPRRLARELVKNHFVVSNMPDQSSQVIVLCIFRPKVETETWKLIDANPQAKVIPALFAEGLRVPVIYADIRYPDFAEDFESAQVLLLQAVERLTRDWSSANPQDCAVSRYMHGSGPW